MRLRIDTSRPYDLAIPIVLSMAAIFVHILGPSLWVSVPVGLAAVLFAPGYALLAFLFPRRVIVVRDGVEHRPLSPLAWFGGSLGLSIALAAVIGFVLNLVDEGVRASTFLAVNSVAVVVLCGGAIVRRANAPVEERFRLRMDWSFSMAGRPAHDRILAVLLVLSALMVVGAVTFVVVDGDDDPRFTELYLLGSDGTASCYPSRFFSGHYEVRTPQSCLGLGNVTVGVVNHEGRSMQYWLRMVWTNETAGFVDSAQEWRTEEFTLDPVPIDLSFGKKFRPQHEVDLTLPPPPGNGTWRLSFQLYTESPPPIEPRDSFLETPYKRLHLFILANLE